MINETLAYTHQTFDGLPKHAEKPFKKTEINENEMFCIAMDLVKRLTIRSLFSKVTSTKFKSFQSY